MKELFSEIRGAVLATLVIAIVCCGLYPLVVFGISQALFHDKAAEEWHLQPGECGH